MRLGSETTYGGCNEWVYTYKTATIAFLSRSCIDLCSRKTSACKIEIVSKPAFRQEGDANLID